MAAPALSFNDGQTDAWASTYRANVGIFAYKFTSFLSHRSLCLVAQWMSVL